MLKYIFILCGLISLYSPNLVAEHEIAEHGIAEHEIAEHEIAEHEEDCDYILSSLFNYYYYKYKTDLIHRGAPWQNRSSEVIKQNILTDYIHTYQYYLRCIEQNEKIDEAEIEEIKNYINLMKSQWNPSRVVSPILRSPDDNEVFLLYE